MQLNVIECAACGFNHKWVETFVDEKGEYYMCNIKTPVLRVEVKRVGVNVEQPAPKPGLAPATWDLVIADMRERDGFGAAKYGVRHQHDNGRNHLVDAYQEGLDQVLYMRAEIERRKRLRELARVLRGPENSSPLTELLDLIEAGL